MRLLPLAAVLVLSLLRPAAAADSAAQFVTKLFVDACVANMGQPVKVREWAQARQLDQISSPGAVGVFVGPGVDGAAWGVPSASGRFALSIRGATEGCAVWAKIANSDEALASFEQLVAGVKRPGIAVSVEKDENSSGPWGSAHQLVYRIAAPNARTGFLLTLLTAEHPGGAFQVSMQATQASLR